MGKGNVVSSAVFSVGLLILVLFVVVGLAGCSSVPGGSAEEWVDALRADGILSDGVASSRYVNESAYEVSDISCTDIAKVDDNAASAVLNAVIVNESFRSELVVNGLYDKQTDKYLFHIVDASTSPLSGVDYCFDSSGNEVPVSSDYDGDSKSTCKVEEDSSAWFLDGPIVYTHSFAFNDESVSWEEEEPATMSFAFSNIDGNYAAKTGDLTRLDSFVVKEFDIATGSFSIDYSLSAYAWQTAASSKEIDISGSLSGYVDVDSSPGFPESGEVYIEAKGNSDSGEGQAVLQGRLTTSSSGEKCIELDSFSFDCASPSSVLIMSDDVPLDSSRTVTWKGNVYMQSGEDS